MRLQISAKSRRGVYGAIDSKRAARKEPIRIRYFAVKPERPQDGRSGTYGSVYEQRLSWDLFIPALLTLGDDDLVSLRLSLFSLTVPLSMRLG